MKNFLIITLSILCALEINSHINLNQSFNSKYPSYNVTTVFVPGANLFWKMFKGANYENTSNNFAGGKLYCNAPTGELIFVTGLLRSTNDEVIEDFKKEMRHMKVLYKSCV